MWFQFILVNFHFAINLLASLVLFSVSWLYFDSFITRKSTKEGLKVLGFLLLSISYLVHSTYVESAIAINPIIGASTNIILNSSLNILGYFFIIIGLFIDPLQKPPFETLRTNQRAILGIGSIPLIFLFLRPIFAGLAGLFYFRKALFGLEHHLRTVAWAIAILTVSEFLALGSLFENTENVDLYNLVAPFRTLWILQHLILLVAIVILAKWVWHYLLKRLQTQLMLIFTTAVVLIFLVTTVSFTFLLLKNLQKDTTGKLKSDVKF